VTVSGATGATGATNERVTLSGIKDWLKTLNVADNYSIGRIDNNKDKSLGVYSRRSVYELVESIGRKSSYDIKAISVLLHWTRNAMETENAVLNLWEKLKAATDITIGGHRVNYIYFNTSEPVSVGADDKGVYEYVIELDLYYTR